MIKADIDVIGTEVVHKWLTGQPDARALFHFAKEDDFANHPECITHGKNILTAVGAIVAGLRDFDSLGPTMEHLGASHGKRHVLAEQFPPLGRAIMDCIKDRLGDKWTPEVANAWESVYSVISVRIVSAMESARALAQSPKPAPAPVRTRTGRAHPRQAAQGGVMGRFRLQRAVEASFRSLWPAVSTGQVPPLTSPAIPAAPLRFRRLRMTAMMTCPLLLSVRAVECGSKHTSGPHRRARLSPGTSERLCLLMPSLSLSIACASSRDLFLLSLRR